MLVTMNDVLLPAKKYKYAVGLFNAVNLEMARGIIEAAEETKSPVIMGTAEVLFPCGPLEELSYFLISMAKKSKRADCNSSGSWPYKRSMPESSGAGLYFYYV